MRDRLGLERQLEVQAPAFYSELGLELGVLKPVAWADLVERPLVPGFDWPIHEGLGWDGAGGQSSILLVSLLVLSVGNVAVEVRPNWPYPTPCVMAAAAIHY